MKSPGLLYAKFYAVLCGEHPYLRFWHFQWLSGRLLYRDLRPSLKNMRGRLLDVGCGTKPYQSWVSRDRVVEIVGLDTTPGASVDVVIKEGEPWPFPEKSFDAVLCTQVLEHVAQLPFVLSEISRVLKPQGDLFLTVPFIYNAHGLPNDFRRFSLQGIQQLIAVDFEEKKAHAQGGAGTSVVALILNWIEIQSNKNILTAGLKVIFFPLWLLFCVVLNMAGWMIDRVDTTENFYQNVFVLAKKKG